MASNIIKEGNDILLKELIFKGYEQLDYTIGVFSSRQLKHKEYEAVIAIALSSRSAIEGHADPYDVYALGELAYQKLSVSNTAEQYLQILQNTVTELCILVQNAKNSKTNSIHIRKTKLYIAEHLNKDFTINDLAEFINLSPSYLSALFKQQENMTLKSYILQERIRGAKNLLKFSNLDIVQIAEYLCFKTQSHFGSVFKKYTGMTPLDYRTKHKPDGNKPIFNG